MTKFYPIYIPNEGNPEAKIWLIGEAGGETEMSERRPFVGESGRLLIECLNRAGIMREEVFLANLCHFRPYDNKFANLMDTDVLKQGILELYELIEKHKPTVIIPLGANPLRFLTGKTKIGNWRGSILGFIHDQNIKCIPTLHPAAVLRNRSTYPIFATDIKRAVSDAEFREKRLPVRKFVIYPTGLELEEWTERLCAEEYLGTDIETVKNSSRILCCGFAPSPELAVCIDATTHEGQRSIQRVLLSNTKKIFQLGCFDTIQLLFLNGYELFDPTASITGRPYFWDTLVAQHILAPELPRSLEYLTSVYTREPYYKTVGRGSIPADTKGWNEKIVQKQSLGEYNCKDCCCTIEIAFLQMAELSQEPEGTQAIFDFEMSMLTVAREISVNGMLVDEQRRAEIEEVLFKKWTKKQFILNGLCRQETNVRSPKLKKILYEDLKMPSRRKRDGKITTDEDAIVSLIAFCKGKIAEYKTPAKQLDWKVNLAVCQLILEIRGIRQVLSNYILRTQRNGRPRASADGRIRSFFKIGPETGRWAASKYVDGTGFNAQTLPRDPVEFDEAILAQKPGLSISDLNDDDEEDEDKIAEQEAEAAA